MIDAILPRAVIAIETRCFESKGLLFPAEQAIVMRAVEKRRREFATGRACAHEALGQLGMPRAPLTSSARGEPQWPSGVVGSITHTDSYCACAVAVSTDIVAIGIDAEPHAPLPAGVPVASIACAEELSRLQHTRRDFSAVHVDRLLFSAKESVFKAWYPLTRKELRFEDALVRFDASGMFEARLLTAAPMVAGQRLNRWSGRWLVRDGLILTAVVRARAAAPSLSPL